MPGKKLLYTLFQNIQNFRAGYKLKKKKNSGWIQILQNFRNGYRYILTEIPNKWIKIIHYVREEVFMYTLFQFPGTDAKYKKLQRWIQINIKKNSVWIQILQNFGNGYKFSKIFIDGYH